MQAKIKPAHLASSSTHAAAHTCTYRGLPTHKPKPNLLTLQAAAHMQQHTHTHTHTHTHASTHKHAHTEIYHTSQNQACQPCIQHHTCSSTHAASHMQQHTCSSTHAAAHMQHHTCSITHAASHMQHHTCNNTHAAAQARTHRGLPIQARMKPAHHARSCTCSSTGSNMSRHPRVMAGRLEPANLARARRAAPA